MAIEIEDTATVEALWAAIQSGRVAYTSYANLLAAIGRPNGSMAEVQGDSGQHTDPVSTLTVDNNGVYRKVTVGWERVSDLGVDVVAEATALRNEAEGFRDEAETAAADAELARVATAALAVGLFADTTAGLAAVASGEYFAVADNTNDVVKIYLDNAGVAVHQFDLPSQAGFDAALAEVGVEISTNVGLMALVDSEGRGFRYYDTAGREYNQQGDDVAANLGKAIAALAPAAVALATTGAQKFQIDRDAHLAAEAIMWEAEVWGEGDSAGVNAIRWPNAAQFSDNVLHVFASEKSGDSINNYDGENGFRGSWRAITVDWDAQTVSKGAVDVILEGAKWPAPDYLGSVGEFIPFKITQGAQAGTIEVLFTSLNPGNVAYATLGTKYDIVRATSADGYTALTTIFDGDTLYTTLGLTAIKPTEAKGPYPVPNAGVVVPEGHVNAGRRVALIGLNANDGTYKNFSIYSELDSAAWALGSAWNFSGLGASFYNEVALAYNSDFHAYGRNDDGAPGALTDVGRLYGTSDTGIDAYTGKTFLTEPDIGNAPNAALGFTDGSGRVIIAGSTDTSASRRSALYYFFSYDGETFVAKTPSPNLASVIGYGGLLLCVDAEGRQWIVHVYEAANGTLGFNKDSTVMMRVMNLAWLLRNATAI